MIDFNPENLDRYFKNQLPELERYAMEQKIAQDPLLQSEVNFQREVVEAICQKRKWELKQRLNALAPETTPIFTLPRIAFGTTLTIAGLLTATLFWFDSKKVAVAPQKQEKSNTKQAKTAKKEQVNITENTAQKEAKETNTIQIPETVPARVPIQQVVYRPQIISALPAKTAKVETAKEEVRIPQTSEFAIQDAIVKAYDETIWFEVGNTDSDNGAFDRNSEIETDLNRLASKQLLRYQYYNGQLSLYNNTSSGKQLHTIIEGQTRHFLLYEGIYYEFFDGQMTETVMQPIRDKEVLKAVKEMLAQLGY